MREQQLSDRHNRGSLLGRLIREARESAGLSQGDLARRLGLSASYMSRLERGEFARPRPQVLTAIAKQLDIQLSDLYAVIGYVIPTELPGFSAYLHTIHPDWPDSAIEQLTDYYEFIKQKHSLH